MSLLNDASLLITPNAYKQGKLYSVIPSNGNGDFSVTRATTATRVNAAGLVELVPYNLLTYSEDLTNANWAKNLSTITANITTAPNGTLTADKLVENTSNGFHWISQNNIGAFQSLTASCYFKKSERDWGLIRMRTLVNDRYAYFNLNNGTIGTVDVQLTASIQDVGNGWYRCSVSTTNPTTATNPIVFGMSNADNVSSYLGDGTSGLFIWGAQLNEGTSALDYQATETRLNIPRLDYSLGSCPNILLEPQRTNLMLRSEEFDNASWVKTAINVTANTTTSPSGLTNADTLTADGTSSFHQAAQLVSGVLNTTYTFSVYAKKNTNNFIQLIPQGAIGGTNLWANFDLNNGVVGSTGSLTTAAITSVGNGWYRCSITGAAVATIIGTFSVLIATSATAARGEVNTLTTSVFVWGAQFEAGAYATSYIPTTSASVTRNADQVLNTSATSLIGQTEGTIYAEFISTAIQSYTQRIINLSDGTISNAIGVQLASSNHLIFYVQNGGINQVVITKTPPAITLGSSMKIAAAYKENDFVFYVNGVQVGTDTSGSVPTTSQIRFTEANGTNPYVGNIKSAALWKVRLTNDQLAALTTL
jgi:hypothetical protein